MKYRELVEGQSDLSDKFTLQLLEYDNEYYQKTLSAIFERKDEDIPEVVIDALIMTLYGHDKNLKQQLLVPRGDS